MLVLCGGNNFLFLLYLSLPQVLFTLYAVSKLLTCNFCDRDYMHPTECIPFHEIFCFKDVDKLRLVSTEV